jgi:hypothetical protein
MSPPRNQPPDPALKRPVARPWEQPDTEFPAVVPVGTLQFDTTGPIAVAVTGLLAYSNGFEFFVTRLLRPDDPGSSAGREPRPPNPGRPRISHESFKIGVEFAGGGQAFKGDFYEMSYEDEPGRPFLYPRGTSTRGHREDSRWWAWPLPPPGQLDFICQLGEAETRISMNAQLILDASRRSASAWPNT